MDKVIFETAKRLKESGFPQPKFAAGQFWYDKDGQLLLVYGVGGHGIVFFVDVISKRDLMFKNRGQFIFAADPISILREMPSNFALVYDWNLHWWTCFSVTTYISVKTNEVDRSNSAEVAAGIYLGLLVNGQFSERPSFAESMKIRKKMGI